MGTSMSCATLAAPPAGESAATRSVPVIAACFLTSCSKWSPLLEHGHPRCVLGWWCRISAAGRLPWPVLGDTRLLSSMRTTCPAAYLHAAVHAMLQPAVTQTLRACGTLAGLQRDLSVGLTAYLPSFLPKLWARPSAVVELAHDPWRHILYLRLQSGAIQVRSCLSATCLLANSLARLPWHSSCSFQKPCFDLYQL